MSLKRAAIRRWNRIFSLLEGLIEAGYLLWQRAAH